MVFQCLKKLYLVKRVTKIYLAVPFKILFAFKTALKMLSGKISLNQNFFNLQCL